MKSHLQVKQFPNVEQMNAYLKDIDSDEIHDIKVVDGSGDYQFFYVVIKVIEGK